MKIPKISREELKERKAELGKHAREELAKTEVMHFRLDPNNILKLYELAEKKRQNPGAMVRQWVLERMAVEMGLLGKVKSKTSVTNFPKSTDNSNALFNAILSRLDLLETEIDRLSSHK